MYLYLYGCSHFTTHSKTEIEHNLHIICTLETPEAEKKLHRVVRKIIVNFESVNNPRTWEKFGSIYSANERKILAYHT